MQIPAIRTYYPLQTTSELLKRMNLISPRHKFSKEEDELLKQLVEEYGETNWMEIASKMKSRNPRQCRERYKNYLSSKISNQPWTEAEDELLHQKYSELGPKWSALVQYFPHRSDVNIKNHWATLQNREIKEKKMHISSKIGLNTYTSAYQIKRPMPQPAIPQERVPVPQVVEIVKEDKDPIDTNDLIWTPELQSVFDDDTLFAFWGTNSP